MGGIAGTLIGTGGPPFLIYLTRRVFDKTALRATMIIMVSFSLFIRLVVFAVAGLLPQPYLFVAPAWFVPAAALGLWLGNRLHLRISRESLLRISHFVLRGCGLSLVGRALFAAQ